MQHHAKKMRRNRQEVQALYTAIRTFRNSLELSIPPHPLNTPLPELSGTPKPLRTPSTEHLVIKHQAPTSTNRQPRRMRYFLLHKPRGCITSTVDDTGRGRPTVYDVAKVAGVPGFGPVGRLDFDTSGALIFTDDYKLKKAISSPTYKGLAKVGTVPSMEKVYHALIAGTVTPDEKGVHQLREPLHFSRKLDGPGGSWTKPAEARVLLTKTFVAGQSVPWRFKPGTTATITWIEVVGTGYNEAAFHLRGMELPDRLLVKALELVHAGGDGLHLRFELTRLHRVSVGPIVLGDLKEGCSRELSRKEVEALYKRCLPLDPLCPTVAEIQDALTCRLSQTARRLQEASELASCQSNTTPREPGNRIEQNSGTGEVEEACAGVGVRDGGGDDGGACVEPSRKQAGAGMGDVEDLQSIVQTLIDFSRRDLHETPPGAAGESAGPGYCPGEEESLAQARAVPPNEAHMTDGYRCSRIEKLGLTYKSM